MYSRQENIFYFLITFKVFELKNKNWRCVWGIHTLSDYSNSTSVEANGHISHGSLGGTNTQNLHVILLL